MQCLLNNDKFLQTSNMTLKWLPKCIFPPVNYMPYSFIHYNLNIFFFLVGSVADTFIKIGLIILSAEERVAL